MSEAAQSMQGRAKKIYETLRDSQVIPGAENEWQEYRTQVSAYLVENCESGGSLAVFGAGRCNDLDLHVLAGHFDTVTLLDADKDAMCEAIRSYREKQKIGAEAPGSGEKVRMQVLNFTGIAQEDYLAFGEVLLALTESDSREEEEQCYLKGGRLLKKMYGTAVSYDIVKCLTDGGGCEKYDYAVSLGVHSQLFNIPAWMVEYVLGNAEKSCVTEEHIWGLLQQIGNLHTAISVKYNEFLLKTARKKAFIGCEVSRAQCVPDGTANDAAACDAGQEEAITAENEKENGETVWYAVPDSAVAGAWQAIRDLEGRALRNEIKADHYLDIVWPFCPERGIAYRMAIFEAEP